MSAECSLILDIPTIISLCQIKLAFLIVRVSVQEISHFISLIIKICLLKMIGLSLFWAIFGYRIILNDFGPDLNASKMIHFGSEEFYGNE